MIKTTIPFVSDVSLFMHDVKNFTFNLLHVYLCMALHTKMRMF